MVKPARYIARPQLFGTREVSKALEGEFINTVFTDGIGVKGLYNGEEQGPGCLLYTSPSPRD